MKFKKVFLIIALILASIIIFASTNKVNAAGTTISETLKIRGLRRITDDYYGTAKVEYTDEVFKGPLVYKFGEATGDDAVAWQIFRKGDDADKKIEDAFYCLQEGVGTGFNSTTKEATYNLAYNMKDATDRAAIKSLLNNISDANYNKILWIIDNMYLPQCENEQERATMKNKLLERVFAAELANTALIPPFEISQVNLSEDDIEVMQQKAIWKYTETNSLSESLRVSTEEPGDIIDSTKFNSIDDIYLHENSERTTRDDHISDLYTYLTAEADKNSAYVSKEDTTVTINKSNAKLDETTSSYKIGPISIAKTGTNETKLTMKVTDGKDDLTYYLVDKNNSRVTDVIGKGDFYIEIPKTLGLSLDKIKINIKVDGGFNTKAEVWTNTDSLEQPVLNVKKEIVEDEADIEIVIEKKFDLALRKYITKINDVAPEKLRVPTVITTKLNTLDAENKLITTATYAHKKDPVMVNTGSVVTYDITIYNEGELDGRAIEVKDQLPTGLKFKQGLTEGYTYTYDETTNIVTIKERNQRENLKAYSTGKLASTTIQLTCEVTAEKGDVEKVLTNIAWISEDSSNNPKDRDSSPATSPNVTDNNLPSYKGNSKNKSDLADATYFYKGQQDDDDFEKLILPPKDKAFDLSLRKFITKINDEAPVISRVPVVDTAKLKDGTATTAKYTHPKDPLLVKTNDIVIYTIRIFNEGELDGFAQEVKDNIPEGLQFIIGNNINEEYRWKLSTDGKSVVTDYLSKEQDEENLLKAYNPETDTLDYKDLKIAFKVTEPNTSDRILINIAEIKDDSDKEGKPVDDRDSTPDNDKEGEDDIDKEYLKLQYFDLALRKFITKINEDDITTRIPEVSIEDDGKITYNHPKDPILVANSDIVTYTIRIFNEGKISGYANEVKDDIPEGLEFLPNNSTNIEYRWLMFDKDGNETTNVKEAVTIRTDYLSEDLNKDNIIKAFNRTTMDLPDYKDVKVVFKVTEKNLPTDRIIINTAEISKDSDDDIDSTPDNDKEDEDDIDKEYLRVTYFDLSLLKWVSKAIVTVDGKTTTTETGYNGLEVPEPIVKVEVDKKKLNKTVVKFAYKIKITNEGELAGYATEVADYIPQGLEFIAADNPLWKLKEDGKIVTDQLKDTLLKPGESATIDVVFKWINGENNLGLKRNVAEISADDNEKDAEDIDSTPDNKKEGEDDIDEALVILSIKTGESAPYILLSTIVIAMLCGGIYLIKRYVL